MATNSASGSGNAHAANKTVTAKFEKYQKDRLAFVQSVVELASRETNIEQLQALGVMGLLRPLLLDPAPPIQQVTAVALGKLANHDADLAKSVVDGDILPQLVYSLAEQNVSSQVLLSHSLAALLQKGGSACATERCKTFPRTGACRCTVWST